jgi:hypothetical protein
MVDRQTDLVAGFDDEQLVAKIKSNADLLEGIAVLLFTRAARNLGDAAPGEDVRINPYAISLDPARWEADGLFDGTGMTPAEARQTEAGGIESMFIENLATRASGTGAPAPAVAAATSGAVAPSGAVEALRLDVVAGGAAGFSIIVENEITFGREAVGAGRLADDPQLSRAHAKITRDGTGGFVISDLSSTNGTFVNATRLDGPVALGTGDKVALGTTTLEVVEAPVAPVAPRNRDTQATVVASRPPEVVG